MYDVNGLEEKHSASHSRDNMEELLKKLNHTNSLL